MLHRNLYCPICGQRVRVEVPLNENGGTLPETHIIPPHTPRDPVNLCCAVVVEVTLRYDTCSSCGCNIAKHPTGMCMGCFAKTSSSPQ